MTRDILGFHYQPPGGTRHYCSPPKGYHTSAGRRGCIFILHWPGFSDRATTD